MIFYLFDVLVLRTTAIVQVCYSSLSVVLLHTCIFSHFTDCQQLTKLTELSELKLTELEL